MRLFWSAPAILAVWRLALHRLALYLGSDATQPLNPHSSQNRGDFTSIHATVGQRLDQHDLLLRSRIEATLGRTGREQIWIGIVYSSVTGTWRRKAGLGWHDYRRWIMVGHVLVRSSRRLERSYVVQTVSVLRSRRSSSSNSNRGRSGRLASHVGESSQNRRSVRRRRCWWAGLLGKLRRGTSGGRGRMVYRYQAR